MNRLQQCPVPLVWLPQANKGVWNLKENRGVCWGFYLPYITINLILSFLNSFLYEVMVWVAQLDKVTKGHRGIGKVSGGVTGWRLPSSTKISNTPYLPLIHVYYTLSAAKLCSISTNVWQFFCILGMHLIYSILKSIYVKYIPHIADMQSSKQHWVCVWRDSRAPWTLWPCNRKREVSCHHQHNIKDGNIY